MHNQGEKKLLSLINATVSHEMRTPINSINSQNIQIKNTIDKISELLENQSISKLSVFKKKLACLQNQLHESNRIHFCSTKFLGFEINDMLDFSQLKQGKFRKMITQFDVRKAINEIYTIQKYKADEQGVRIEMKFDSFPPADDANELCGKRFTICTDEQRLQQVLINVVSNALKFTPTGGSIFIFCKLLRPSKESDFGRI